MKPEALKRDEAENAFDRFREAVAQIAAVPKNGKVSPPAQVSSANRKTATKKK